jgi:hypothetical protein
MYAPCDIARENYPSIPVSKDITVQNIKSKRILQSKIFSQKGYCSPNSVEKDIPVQNISVGWPEVRWNRDRGWVEVGKK